MPGKYHSPARFGSKISVLILFSALLFPQFSQADTADTLASEHLVFESADGRRVLDNTRLDVRAIFESYEPVVDASSQIVAPKNVTGDPQAPRLELGIRACVFIICKTVMLDSDITIRPTAGKCEKNLLLKAQLQRSSPLLSNIYESLDVTICFNGLRNGPGRNSGATQYDLTVSASAHRAPTYNSGLVASNALRFLKLQIPSMLKALNSTLESKGANALTIQSP